jgi:hypothetical protein
VAPYYGSGFGLPLIPTAGGRHWQIADDRTVAAIEMQFYHPAVGTACNAGAEGRCANLTEINTAHPDVTTISYLRNCVTWTPILSALAVLTPVVQKAVVDPDSHSMVSASLR